MLTRKQRELLDFIRDYQKREEGISPTLQEMVTGVGLKTRSGVHRLLVQLEERGFIRRLKNRTRAIEVLLKGGVAPTKEQQQPAITIERHYLLMPNVTVNIEDMLADHKVTEMIEHARLNGKRHKFSVTVRLQELGGQG